MGASQSQSVSQEERPPQRRARSVSSTSTRDESVMHPGNEAAESSTVTIANHKEKKIPKDLSGMALVNYQCRKSKRKYDKCVKEWYSREFMTGQGSLNQPQVCGDMFDTYRECILKGIKREIWDKQGLPPPKEGSLLAELDDDE